MMDRSLAPDAAAAVACPARSEWPAYLDGSRPARSASFFTTRATSTGDNQPACSCPCRFSERNSAPLHIPADSIRLDSTHRARLGIGIIRDSDLPSGAILIRFAPAQRHREAVLAKSATVQTHEFRPSERSGETLKLDMAAWFTPPAGNYFGRIGKAKILEGLREVKGSVAPAWQKMKKADLAALAERELSCKLDSRTCFGRLLRKPSRYRKPHS